MPLKSAGEATDYSVIDRHEGGVGWLAHPEETMQRASHALAVDGDVWVVDPVDIPDLDDLLAEYGDVAGVVVLLDRHKRDAAAVAKRHDVPVYVPEWMTGVAKRLDAPTEFVGDSLPETDVEVHKVVENAVWQEAALWLPDRETLMVAESLGTAPYFLAGSERLGVHPMRRLTPPKSLREFSPERVLVGHGQGIHEGATEAVDDAITGSRTRSPVLLAKTVRNFLLD